MPLEVAHGDQENRDRHRDPRPPAAGTLAGHRLEVEQEIPDPEQRDRAQHRQIAPVPPCEDLPANHRSEKREKTEINGGHGHRAIPSETVTATRPATQTAASASSGQPTTGSRPVQFGTAVSRNPATTAGTKPNSSA